MSTRRMVLNDGNCTIKLMLMFVKVWECQLQLSCRLRCFSQTSPVSPGMAHSPNSGHCNEIFFQLQPRLQSPPLNRVRWSFLEHIHLSICLLWPPLHFPNGWVFEICFCEFKQGKFKHWNPFFKYWFSQLIVKDINGINKSTRRNYFIFIKLVFSSTVLCWS